MSDSESSAGEAGAAVTAAKVSAVRDATSAPLMYCKQCLVHSAGNIEGAIDLSRQGWRPPRPSASLPEHPAIVPAPITQATVDAVHEAGFSQSEARDALRRTQGDVLMAAGYAYARTCAVRIGPTPAHRERWNLDYAAAYKARHVLKDNRIVSTAAPESPGPQDAGPGPARDGAASGPRRTRPP